MPPLYDPEAVRPMWEELANVGVQPLTTAQEVDEALAQSGVTLLVINSVCGCAAGGARPGVMQALQNKVIPDRSVTVFAGMDPEAVARARQHLAPVPPSSPCIALFKDGKPLAVLERRHIEQMDADAIAQTLVDSFNQYCSAAGPSISPEEFARLNPFKACGSTIPMYNG